MDKKIDEKTLELLNGPNFASIATLMKDGSPQVTPVWIDVDQFNNYILVNTAKGRVKERNIDRDNRVAMSIFDSQNPYNFVSIRGKVIEKTTNKADHHIDSLTQKYLGIKKYPYRKSDEQRIILKIEPTNIFHFNIPLPAKE
ncbi:MAG: PPOX class F420-dependent oxidoreductase [Nitrososphaeraceae archaeon]